jgi:hypothetical protein
LVRKGRLDVQNALNVAQMLFAFTFLIKDHFPKDDVFRRCNVDRPMQGIFSKAVPPSLGKFGIATCEPMKPAATINKIFIYLWIR